MSPNIKDWLVSLLFGVVFGFMYFYALFGTYF